MGRRPPVAAAGQIEERQHRRPPGVPVAIERQFQGTSANASGPPSLPFPPKCGSLTASRPPQDRKAKAAAAAAAAAPRKQPTPEEMDTLKLKKAWEVALAPVKSLPMTAIMMYMSGNSLQIFSIMMVFMAFKTPLLGIIGTQQAFERFESDGNRGRLLQVKAAYVAMQILALALGVWKVNAMGLLP